MLSETEILSSVGFFFSFLVIFSLVRYIIRGLKMVREWRKKTESQP